jgi:hypothetical protein
MGVEARADRRAAGRRQVPMPRIQYTLEPTGLPQAAWLQVAAGAEGWRSEWRPRALDARLLHSCVPGLAAGPGFELLGDARGTGWLEFRRLAGPAAQAEEELQRLLEVTRRAWGLLVLLPSTPGRPVRLLERPRDRAAGRRLAAAAAERLLRQVPPGSAVLAAGL